jgi:shikimate kinase
MKKNIILVGLMGAGKSTVGRYLAKRMRREFYDTDAVIVERTGVSIPTIFEIEGEQGFRDREECVIEELSHKQGMILATGGGSVIRPINRRRLEKIGTVVYLRGSAELLFSRISYDTNRPLMQTDNPLQTLKDLLSERDPLYMEVADLVVITAKQKLLPFLKQVERKIIQIEDFS